MIYSRGCLWTIKSKICFEIPRDCSADFSRALFMPIGHDAKIGGNTSADHIIRRRGYHSGVVKTSKKQEF